MQFDSASVRLPTGQSDPFGAFGGIWAQTPELDSLLLFASGVLGLGTYIRRRRRAG